jgi:hypothetical protein
MTTGITTIGTTTATAITTATKYFTRGSAARPGPAHLAKIAAEKLIPLKGTGFSPYVLGFEMTRL